jgi:hypothetical protein
MVPRRYTQSALIVAGRDPAVCRPISEALTAVDVVVQRLVSRVVRAEEIVSRADAEGGVPIVLSSTACEHAIPLLAEMIACDALPGRAYVLVAATDVTAAVAAEDVERALPDSVDRVLVTSLSDLSHASTRDLLRMHLSRACASYLGRSPRTARVLPAPVTEMPFGERVINEIDRRAMQRGMFKVSAPRVPRF